MRTTIKDLVEREMAYHGDDWSAVVSYHPGLSTLLAPVDSMDLRPFTVWTRDRVYFPVVSGWCGSASRHPDKRPTEAQG